MKRIFFPLLLLAFLLWPARAPGQNSTIVTATITVTNTAGTTNGQTLTVNGDTRTWTNNVQVPATQILTNNSIIGAATNMFNQASDFPFANLSLAQSSTNGITLQGIPNATVTVALSAGWGAFSYVTNFLTNTVVLRLPMNVISAAEQTNLASMVAAGLDSSTNPLSATDVLLQNYDSLSQTQTVSGAKALTNAGNLYGGIVNSPSISGTGGTITNLALLNANSTNLVNRGNAISSPGSAALSEQFGASSAAGAASATTLGAFSQANGGQSSAFGYAANAGLPGDTALGTGASASGGNSTALGESASASATNSTALGVASSANYSNSTAVGYLASNTAPKQVMLGSPGVSTVVNNALQVNGGATFGSGVTNVQFNGTNTFLAGSDIAFTRYPISSVANGNNILNVGTNVFIELSGATASFTNCSINAQPNRDGKTIFILYSGAQQMDWANLSGFDSTAANRITSLSGADKAITGKSFSILVYSANIPGWVLCYFGQ